MYDATGIHETLKPSLRGVSHQIAFFFALLGAAALVGLAANRLGSISGAIYGASLAGMLGASALYHRPTWSPAALRRMRSVDHAGIFLLIAGTYTPVCLVGLKGTLGLTLLGVVWLGALLGIGHTLFFAHRFRALNAMLYVLLGCAAVPTVPWLWEALGAYRTALLLGGGAIYIAGAAVYSKRWPNPAPAHFGYHELFHLMVIAAAGLHFAAVLDLVA